MTVCTSLDENLYGISLMGALLWKTNLGGILDSNPVLHAKESLVIVATRDAQGDGI